MAFHAIESSRTPAVASLSPEVDLKLVYQTISM